jgi:hypothetical protein
MHLVITINTNELDFIAKGLSSKYLQNQPTNQSTNQSIELDHFNEMKSKHSHHLYIPGADSFYCPIISTLVTVTGSYFI